MATRSKNAQGRPEAETPDPKPAAKPAPAKAEAAGAVSAPDAPIEGAARGPEATKAPAKTGEADAGSSAPGVDQPRDQDDHQPSRMEVVVVGPKQGRWRAGRHFGAEPTRIPLQELTEDEKAALVGDPVLIIQVVEVGSPL